MKAVVMTDFGGPEVLEFRDVVDPVAREGEILADVFAASVNPVDWKIRQGHRRDALAFSLPHILGLDFSGVIRAVGPGVEGLSAGDKVFGVTAQDAEGTYAEAVAIKADQVAKMPEGLSHAEAASLALVGLTALVSLEDVARLQPNETILIHAAAGGVGGFAVQYARHVGARVLATASANNHDYVRRLGADEIIDYTSADFTDIGAVCDVVYDTIGGDTHEKSFEVLKQGGRLVYIARPNEGFSVPRDDVACHRPQVGRDRAHLERINELVANGAVRPPELTHMKLNQAAAAHGLSAAGHVRGKIVFDVR